MRFHPRAFLQALVILGVFFTLLLLGMDPRLGAIAILAVAAVDALSFLLPLGIGTRERPSSDPENPSKT